MVRSTRSPLTSSRPAWIIVCTCRSKYRTRTGPYVYPSSSTIWKNSRHTVHTAADPPNQGRMILAIIGCTWNSRKALTTVVSAYSNMIGFDSSSLVAPAVLPPVRAGHALELSHPHHSRPLLVRRHPRDSLSDHQRVNVVGSLIRLHRFQVAHVPHDRIFVRDPVGAQQVAAQPRAFERHPDVVPLQHRNVRRVELPLVLQPPRLHRQQLPFGDFGDHPSQLLLHQLVRSDRPVVELFAHNRILPRALAALPGRAPRAAP